MLQHPCSVRPAHPQQILLGVVVIFQFALIGVMQCFAYAASQMNIGGRHQRCAIRVFHCHDAFERVFLVFPIFMVMHEMHNFIAVGLKNSPFKLRKPAG